MAQRGQGPIQHASCEAPEFCRPELISPRALARRAERAWPRGELRAALAHLERMLGRDAALWAGKAGTTRRRLLNALVGAAQERESLEVEETLERLADAVGLQSAGTVWERIGELERAGWLLRLVTGRKGHHGSVWRLQVPPRLRAATSRRHLVPSANRDIKKELSDLRLFDYRVVEESLTPRLAAPMEPVQITPTGKSAAMEGCSPSLADPDATWRPCSSR